MAARFTLIADASSVSELVFGAISSDLFDVFPLGRDSRAGGETDSVGVRDAVLVEWDVLKAGPFEAVCSLSRHPACPVVALLRSGASATAPLALGADTFHSLPPSLDLLEAQVLAHRRQRGDPPSLHEGGATVTAGCLTLGLDDGRLTCGGQSVKLTLRQTGVLKCFLLSPGRILSRDHLLAEVWGWDFDPGTNVVDVYVHYVRHALERMGLGTVIETVRGRGYRLSEAGLGHRRTKEGELVGALGL